MTTSGQFSFNPSLGELGLYAFSLAGLRNTALAAEHMMSLRMAANLLQATWANKGVNLWAVDLVTTTLVQGTATYDVDPSTVLILDAYVVVDDGVSPPVDRIILPISRTEYASYPSPEMQGFPTVFWFNRLLSPQLTIWPVPNGEQQYLKYYRVRQIQDSVLAGGTTVEIPFLFLEAYALDLAWRLALIWAPDKVAMLKPLAFEAYQAAANTNVEMADQYITPQISSYFRV